MTMEVRPEHAAKLREWASNLPSYAADQLWIAGAGDTLLPLRFNPMQIRLHTALERQKAETGKVRAIILKARQLGASTYIAGRFFHQLHLSSAGKRAFVLAHDQSTAQHLGRMVGLMYESLLPSLRRQALKANDHERTWVNGSRYEVRTGSTPSGGRGGTVTLYHSSEVAYQEHAQAHLTGSARQVHDIPGTEKLYESTAAGPMGPFYDMWRAAVNGQSDYLALFFPWTLEPEYSHPAPRGFTLDPQPPNDEIPSEVEYAQLHGCTNEQMYWRRRQIVDVGGGSNGALLFAREYPITPEEAFLGVATDSFLDPRKVHAALARPTNVTGEVMQHPLIIGVDPSPAHGDSGTAIVWRRGRVAYRIERQATKGLDPEELANWILTNILVRDDFMRMCIDESEGVGHHLVTHLSRLAPGAGKIVGVKFGEQAQDPMRYANKRAEMYDRAGAWINNEGAIVNETSLDTARTIGSELLSVRRHESQDLKLQLEKKSQIKARGLPSPDGADAFVLTFALPDPRPEYGAGGYHRMDTSIRPAAARASHTMQRGGLSRHRR